MAKVTFTDLTVLDLYEGVSSKGNPYAKLKFFSLGDVYEIFLFGKEIEAVKGIAPKSVIKTLSFGVVPDLRGGVRLIPGW